ncbi:MoaD/ThiS family protein [Thermoplasma sp.]|uniref:MoaD/ThiS family protein n=1 Tax=Thermoplasma sp. TaxID=1973142 RepID=UPI0025CF236D|nr:MoaD/ThiS family protein [Thermoplasma sp.]
MIKVRGHIRKEMSIDSDTRVSDLMAGLGLNENEYVVIVNGSPALGDHLVKKDDDVVILEVFSGG